MAALSVVIPALDEAELIAGAVRSAWEGGADEVIIADGGSTDDTKAEAERAGAIVIMAPRGRARQIKAGIAQSRGRVILVLHADSRLPRGARQEIERLLALPRTAGGAFPVRFLEKRWSLRLIAFGINLRSWLGWACTGDQAQFFRRTALLHVGGIPDLPFLEDIVLWNRLRRIGRLHLARFCVMTSARRFEARGPWRTTVQMWQVRFLHRFGRSPTALATWYESLGRDGRGDT